MLFLFSKMLETLTSADLLEPNGQGRGHGHRQGQKQVQRQVQGHGQGHGPGLGPVSYTHLTLPTKA